MKGQVRVIQLRELTCFAVVLRVFTAVLIGGIIGVERGMKNRPAGLRTYMVVCLGACLVMITNQYVYQYFGVGDPVRMGAQVISGIGFLGAGTIVVTRHNQIKGLTTAAGLWAAAGVGLAIGIGFYEGALCGGFAVFVTMTLLQRIDGRMHRAAKFLEVYYELKQDASLGDFFRQVRGLGIEIRDTHRESGTENEYVERAYISTLKLQKRQSHKETLERLRDISGLAYIEEL